MWMSWVYATVMSWPEDLPHLIPSSSCWRQFLMPQHNCSLIREECGSVVSLPCNVPSPTLASCPGKTLAWLPGDFKHLLHLYACSKELEASSWSIACLEMSWLQAVKNAEAGAHRQTELGQAPALCQIYGQGMSSFTSWECLKMLVRGAMSGVTLGRQWQELDFGSFVLTHNKVADGAVTGKTWQQFRNLSPKPCIAPSTKRFTLSILSIYEYLTLPHSEALVLFL